jgi:hypothetical protein
LESHIAAKFEKVEKVAVQDPPETDTKFLGVGRGC